MLSVSAVKAATDRIRSRSVALTASAANACAAKTPVLSDTAPACIRKLRRFMFILFSIAAMQKSYSRGISLTRNDRGLI